MTRIHSKNGYCAGLVVLLATLLTIAPAHAQDGAGWQFRVTPYLWAPTLYGDVAVTRDQPTAEADGVNLLDALDFAVLVAGEARHGKFFLLGEFNYVALSDSKVDIRNRVTTSAEAKLDVIETALSAGYRMYQSDRANVDLFGGLRYWRIDGTVDFTLAGPIVGSRDRHYSGDKDWVDPIVGARVEIPFGKSWYASLLGDVGGFGIGSEYQYEVIGQVGYRFNETWALSGGYRHIAVDFDEDDFLLDAALTGPFLALGISF